MCPQEWGAQVPRGRPTSRGAAPHCKSAPQRHSCGGGDPTAPGQRPRRAQRREGTLTQSLSAVEECLQGLVITLG